MWEVSVAHNYDQRIFDAKDGLLELDDFDASIEFLDGFTQAEVKQVAILLASMVRDLEEQVDGEALDGAAYDDYSEPNYYNPWVS